MPKRVEVIALRQNIATSSPRVSAVVNRRLDLNRYPGCLVKFWQILTGIIRIIRKTVGPIESHTRYFQIYTGWLKKKV